jgi:hypothetical protein
MKKAELFFIQNKAFGPAARPPLPSSVLRTRDLKLGV